MRNLNKRKIVICLFLMNLNLSLSFAILTSNGLNTFNNEQNNLNPKSSQIDPNGKEFDTISVPAQSCYINMEQPSLSKQPEVYIPNFYISHGDMNFQNITALNYTKIIESKGSKIIGSDPNNQTFLYQLFSIELSQFINNISIYIQDINSEEKPVEYNNSWEVAILNCSIEHSGIPNLSGIPKPDEELAALLKPPLPVGDYGPTWYDFDFQNSDLGPIYLNTSKTCKTFENGKNKYWFAFRVKIPPDTNGPKFLFFNPDEGDSSDIGEGHTFLFVRREIGLENFTYNNVTYFSNPPSNGNILEGALDSFQALDDDRYIVEPNFDNLTFFINFTVREVSKGSYETLRSQGDFYWYTQFPVFSIDLELSTMIENIENVNQAILYVYNFTSDQWLSLENALNITKDDEKSFVRRFSEPAEIRSILHCIDNNNNVSFKFEYNGTGDYSVNINKFTLNIGERITTENSIQRYDPFLIEHYTPNSFKVVNGTLNSGSRLGDIESNDNVYFGANSDSSNLSIEFKFNLLQNADSALWEDISIWDWFLLYPNPLVWQIILTLRSNVSITTLDNLSIAVLELYKGDKEYDFLNDDENAKEWFNLTDYKSSVLNAQDETKFEPDAISTDIAFSFLQFLNASDDNSLILRLRYEWNQSQTPPSGGFNVSIDEFRLTFYVQNVITSDIASKIGFGLDSSKLKPEDIFMKNLGLDVVNTGNQHGNWDEDILDGIPIQGIYRFNVTSIWPFISFEVGGQYQIYKFSIEIDFGEKLKTQYMTGTNYFIVEVTDNDGNGLEGLEITFELLDSNDKVIDKDDALTDRDGEAKGALNFEEAGEKYKIKVTYDEEGIYNSEDIESDEFRIDNEITSLMNTLIIWSPYILIGIAALVTFVVVRHHKLSKLRVQWAREALNLDDLLKISYILIIHKDAGVTIYNKQISMDLDSDLIGGFLTAISQFRSELKKDGISKPGEKGFEMDYYDNKIVITDGQYARVALILDGIPSDLLKENQWDFTRKFEAKFGADLVDFKGDIKPFREADDLIDEAFNIKLMYPLQLAKHWEFTKLNKLEKALVEVGFQMQKERKFIFASSLLSYGLAGRKASRDQIISTILELKRRGILIPVEME